MSRQLPATDDQDARRDRAIDARTLLLQRRSALGFDGRTAIDRGTFFDMLSRVLPSGRTPWISAWWDPRVHLAIFVHRVDEVPSGLYLLLRDPRVFDRLRAACRPDLWEAVDGLPLWRLAHADARALARPLRPEHRGGRRQFNASTPTRACRRSGSRSIVIYSETGMVGQMPPSAGAAGTGHRDWLPMMIRCTTPGRAGIVSELDFYRRRPCR